MMAAGIRTALEALPRHREGLAVLVVPLIADAHKGLVHFDDAGHFPFRLVLCHSSENLVPPRKGGPHCDFALARAHSERLSLQGQEDKLLPHLRVLVRIGENGVCRAAKTLIAIAAEIPSRDLVVGIALLDNVGAAAVRADNDRIIVELRGIFPAEKAFCVARRGEHSQQFSGQSITDIIPHANSAMQRLRDEKCTDMQNISAFFQIPRELKKSRFI